MSATDLQEYVGAPDTDQDFVADCWAQADKLVTEFVGDHPVPFDALLRATLEVGSELYHRRSAPSGISQFASMDGTPIRVARDPMVGAYPILRRFLPGGFA